MTSPNSVLAIAIHTYFQDLPQHDHKDTAHLPHRQLNGNPAHSTTVTYIPSHKCSMCRFDLVWYKPCDCKVFNGPPQLCPDFQNKDPQHAKKFLQNDENSVWGQRVWIEPDGSPAVKFEKDSVCYETVDPVLNQLYNQTTCPGQEYIVKYLEFADPCPYHVNLEKGSEDEKKADAAAAGARKRELEEDPLR